MPGVFDEWYHPIPIVTKTYMTACFITTLAVHIDLLNPLHLYYNWQLVWYEFKLWRLVTNFLFFDYFGLNWIFHMYFFVRHSWELEDQFYRGKTSDYLFFFILGGSMLLAIVTGFAQFPGVAPRVMFLGPSLSFMVVYVWSRKNPQMTMSFLGMFQFTVPYLPWVILGFGYLLGQNPVHDLLGICVGHIYYYLNDIYPQVRPGRRIIRTPTFLSQLLDQPRRN